MTQTNVVPIDQKQERAPHLRNIDLTVEQQLSDLELRLENEMRVNKKLGDQIERLEKMLTQSYMAFNLCTYARLWFRHCYT